MKSFNILCHILLMYIEIINDNRNLFFSQHNPFLIDFEILVLKRILPILSKKTTFLNN